MAKNKPKSIKEAHAQGSMYYWDKNGNKQLAVTAKQLAAFKKSELYDPDSKKGALTQWANAAKKQGIEAVIPALKTKREAEERRKAEVAETKRQAELKKRQEKARKELEARKAAEKKREFEIQAEKRLAELEQRQEAERKRIEAEKRVERFAQRHSEAASQSDKFERAIEYLMKNEGGYYKSDNEEVNYGITKKSYPELDIKNLTVEQAIEIYRNDWWQQYKDLPAQVAIKIFDAAVNVGHHRAGHWLKDATAEAGEFNIEGILDGISRRQLAHYQHQDDWEKYQGGWTARAHRIPEKSGPDQKLENELGSAEPSFDLEKWKKARENWHIDPAEAGDPRDWEQWMHQERLNESISKLRREGVSEEVIANYVVRNNEQHYGVNANAISDTLHVNLSHRDNHTHLEAWDPNHSSAETLKMEWALRELLTMQNIQKEYGRAGMALEFMTDAIPTLDDLFLLDTDLIYPMDIQTVRDWDFADNVQLDRAAGFVLGLGAPHGKQLTRADFFKQIASKKAPMSETAQLDLATDPRQDIVGEKDKMTLTYEANDTDVFHETIHKLFNDLHDQGYLTSDEVNLYRKNIQNGVSMEHVFIDDVLSNYGTNQDNPHFISQPKKNFYDDRIRDWIQTAYPGEADYFNIPTRDEVFQPIYDMLNNATRKRREYHAPIHT